jgi:hypothetical protein
MRHFGILRLQPSRLAIRAAVVALIFVLARLDSSSVAVAAVILPNGNATRGTNYLYPDGVSWANIGPWAPATTAQLSDVVDSGALPGALSANSGGKHWTINSTHLGGNYQLVQYFAWAGQYFGSNSTTVGPFTFDASTDTNFSRGYGPMYPNIGGALMGLKYDG